MHIPNAGWRNLQSGFQSLPSEGWQNEKPLLRLPLADSIEDDAIPGNEPTLSEVTVANMSARRNPRNWSPDDGFQDAQSQLSSQSSPRAYEALPLLSDSELSEKRCLPRHIGLSLAWLTLAQLAVFCGVTLTSLFTSTCTGGAPVAAYAIVAGALVVLRYGESALVSVVQAKTSFGRVPPSFGAKVSYRSIYQSWLSLLFGASSAVNFFTDLHFLSQAKSCSREVEEAWPELTSEFPSVRLNTPPWDVVDRTTLRLYRQEFLFFQATFSRSVAFLAVTIILPQIVAQVFSSTRIIWRAVSTASYCPSASEIRWLASQGRFLSLSAILEQNAHVLDRDQAAQSDPEAPFLLPLVLRWAYQHCWYGLLLQPQFLKFVWPRLSRIAAAQAIFSITMSLFESLRDQAAAAMKLGYLLKGAQLRFSLRIAFAACIVAPVLHSYGNLLLAVVFCVYISCRPRDATFGHGMIWFILIGALVQACTGYTYFLPTISSALRCELRNGAVACIAKPETATGASVASPR